MNRKHLTVGIVGLAGLLVTAAATARSRRPVLGPTVAASIPAKIAARKIQVALLLDTSGSMDGLIDQAKSQLWRIVNELAAARKQGQAAQVEIALYEYGKSTVSAEDGFVRRILPFTTDLDRVSEELFALRTNGGDEYCGRAIREAVTGLEWSPSKDDLKLVFIAGNESFDQGPITPGSAIGLAVEKGITVNVIHCGGDDPSWREGARLARGEFLMIDHNSRVMVVAAPQDADIERLGNELNATYIGYGAGGRAAKERQEKQDANSVAAAQGASTQRALSKASGAYRNATWDLVDAMDEGKVDLEKADDLPEEMAKMTVAERKAFVAAAAGKRKELQAKIKSLSVEREKFVAAEMAKRGEEGGDTLDKAMIKVVRAQAETRGYAFAK
jgi:hypothetical protein